MDENVSFNAYLEAKLIDADQFIKEDFDQFKSLKEVFELMHPASFTAQKLFLINPIRRKFPFEIKEQPVESVEKPKLKFRPKIKR